MRNTNDGILPHRGRRRRTAEEVEHMIERCAPSSPMPVQLRDPRDQRSAPTCRTEYTELAARSQPDRRRRRVQQRPHQRRLPLATVDGTARTAPPTTGSPSSSPNLTSATLGVDTGAIDLGSRRDDLAGDPRRLRRRPRRHQSSHTTFGAAQNRIESGDAEPVDRHRNMAAAQSRIQDADFAARPPRWPSSRMMQQAGVSVLVQANQNRNQSALRANRLISSPRSRPLRPPRL